MNAATIFKTLTTVTLSITLLITGGCNNMEAKKEETGKNTAIENIFARKSVRTYTPQPIEKEKVDMLRNKNNISVSLLMSGESGGAYPTYQIK